MQLNLSRTQKIVTAVLAVSLTAVIGFFALQQNRAPQSNSPNNAATSIQDQLISLADEVLANHRRLVALLDGEAQLDAAQRQVVSSVGHQLFHHNLNRMNALLEAAAPEQGLEERLGAVAALLDRIETERSWYDADRLAFKDFLTRLGERYARSQTIAGLKLARRIDDDLTVLNEIEKAYDKELKDIFGRFAQRGITLQREKWASYAAFVKSLYSREQIFKDYAVILPAPSETPPIKPEDLPKQPSKESGKELFGAGLPAKTVLLTFDDGPHGRYTDEILEILKRYQAQAVFFHLGRNLGSVDAQGQVKAGPGMATAKRVLQAGHVLANHSYSHSQMPKLQTADMQREAADTEALLNATGRTPSALFRFPYGARNAQTLSALDALKLRSMMWNIDSMDWADPVPKSIAQRVLDQVSQYGRGIVLFHDIQAKTVQALPAVLDQLAAEGYRFASWKDGQFSVGDAKPVQAPAASNGDTLYRESHALIVGIDAYEKWPQLKHAVKDAQAVREALVSRFGFKPERITTLLDKEATRANVLRALNDKLADAKAVKRDDRVFVFFAGHGATRKLSSGRDVGYLIPVDAPLTDYASDAISMPQLQEVAEALSAKHVLFVLDACYSGLGLTRGASNNYLADNARRIGRQMITAGGADQTVADDGPAGHSVFTWTLLQALAGKADANNDGFITSTELAAYISPAVAAISRQTPAFGSLPGSEGGEFVFELPLAKEGISSDTRQLDAISAKLNAQLDAARDQATAPAPTTAGKPANAPNAQVTVTDLEGKTSQLVISSAPASGLSAKALAQRANERGMVLYRERRYDESEQAFTEALKLYPDYALAANNLGFIYYKRNKPTEAARWYTRALELDPTRAIAYLNLGDAYLLAKDDAAAAKAYATFTSLSPTHVRSASLKTWGESPDKAQNRPAPAP
jgi:peptidoglycan/xylan/chitin deacetylase (PgdA/CDA1 family)/uncharacterized caspase-like protein